MSPYRRRKIITDFFHTPEPETSAAVYIALFFIITPSIFLLSNGDDLGVAIGSFLILFTLAIFLVLPYNAIPVHHPDGRITVSASFLNFRKLHDRYMNRPTHHQVMECFRDDLDKIVKKSSEKLGITNATRPPITVIGPVLWKVKGLNPRDVTRRHDTEGKIYTYSTYKITVFHFAEHFFGAYETYYNLIKGTHVGESTRELFYRNVVEVQVKSDSSNYSLNDKEKLEQGKAFSLSVSSGNSIEVFINDPILIKAGEEIESMGDSAVKNIRAMLREYKTRSN